MHSQKTLIFGGYGFLGSTVLRYFPSQKTVAPTHGEHDLLQEKTIYQLIEKEQPDTIIYLAGITKIDFAEKNQEITYKLNADIPRKIAKFIAKTKIPFIYISTDAVFDGYKQLYHFDEDVKPHAQSIYGLSKLQGEYFVQNINTNNAIVRLITLYGTHPTKINFATTMIDSLKKKKQFFGIVDQIQNPLYIETAAKGIQFITQNKLSGIYHLGGIDDDSNYNFLVRFAKDLQLNSSYIKGITFAEFMKGKEGHRKQKSVLLCKKFQNISNQKILLTLDESIQEFAHSIKYTK